VVYATIGTSFFPKDLHNVFVVNLDLPEGSPIRATRDVAIQAVRKIDELEGKRIKSYTTFVGAGGPRFWLSIEPEQRSDNYAQILVHTVVEGRDSLDRCTTPRRASAADSRIPRPHADARNRPPIGIPVQLRIYGEDIQKLRELAAQVKARMRAIPGTIDIHDDWGDPVFQMTLKIDNDRAALSG
jgi:multidrug efflux pump subunit AcrB